jgi:hypothetical protein
VPTHQRRRGPPPIKLPLTVPAEHRDLQPDVLVTTVARLRLTGPRQGYQIIAATDGAGTHD